MVLVSFRLSNLFLICFKLIQLLWVVASCKSRVLCLFFFCCRLLCVVSVVSVVLRLY